MCLRLCSVKMSCTRKYLKEISTEKDRKLSHLSPFSPSHSALVREGSVTQHYLDLSRQLSRRMWILFPAVHPTFSQGIFFLRWWCQKNLNVVGILEGTAVSFRWWVDWFLHAYRSLSVLVLLLILFVKVWFIWYFSGQVSLSDRATKFSQLGADSKLNEELYFLHQW